MTIFWLFFVLSSFKSHIFYRTITSYSYREKLKIFQFCISKNIVDCPKLIILSLGCILHHLLNLCDSVKHNFSWASSIQHIFLDACLIKILPNSLGQKIFELIFFFMIKCHYFEGQLFIDLKIKRIRNSIKQNSYWNVHSEFACIRLEWKIRDALIKVLNEGFKEVFYFWQQLVEKWMSVLHFLFRFIQTYEIMRNLYHWAPH